MKTRRRSKVHSEKIPVPAETVTVEKAFPKKLSLMLAILCAATGFFLYINTLGHSYVVDDDTVMQKNEIVKQGVKSIPEIFITPYRKGFWDRQEGIYRPLPLSMFAFEWQIAPAKPVLGHLVNILLYALTGFVLFFTLKRMMSKYSLFIPFFATLLFMAHPVHTEVVANIKSRDEILCFLFLMLSLYFLTGYCKSEKRKPGAIISSVVCFLLALLSKESAVTFLIVFPLVIYFFTGLRTKKIIQYSALFLIPLSISIGLRFYALKGINNQAELLPINNSLVVAENKASQVATAVKITGKYAALLFFPHPLVYDYSYNQIPNVTFGDKTVLICILVYTALMIYVVRTFREKNIFAFCLLYFFITISLVSNLVILIESTMGERFLFTTSLGFCIALPLLLSALFKMDPKNKNIGSIKKIFAGSKPVSFVLIVILLLYSVKTMSRNADWKTNFSLLKKDVKNSPNSARIHYAYGAEIFFKHAIDEKDPSRRSGLVDQAIVQLERGVSILPTYAEAFYNLGLAYTEKKDSSNALRCFEAARNLKEWKEPDFFVFSALAFGLAKRYDAAFSDFQTAANLDPGKKETYSNWGNYLCEAGRVSEAIEKLKKAIAIDPEYADALYNMGNVYAQTGNYSEAITWYEKVLTFDANYADAYNNIGNCRAAMKDIPSAIQAFQKVLKIDPSNIKAIKNLAVSYHFLGDEKKSNEYAAMIPPGN